MIRNIAFLSLFFLVGCSASGPLYKDFISTWQRQQADTARVVVYMPKGNLLNGDAYFGANGKRLGLVKAEGFNVVDLVPGAVTLEVEEPGTIWPSCKTKAELPKGSINFFEIRWAEANDKSINLLGRLVPILAHATDGDGKCSGGFRLVPTTEEAANEHLGTMRLSN